MRGVIIASARGVIYSAHCTSCKGVYYKHAKAKPQNHE